MTKERLIEFAKEHRRQIIVIACGFFAVLFYIFPWLVMGEDSYILIFENLDSETVHTIYFAENFFRWTGIIPEYMGVDVRCMNIFALAMAPFYLMFGHFVAYVMWDAIVRAVAYAGVYLLCSKMLEGKYWPICIIGGVIFAFMPMFTIYGLTIAGLPLIAWAFWNLIRNQRIKTGYACIAFYALTSSLVLFSWYVVAVMFVVCTVVFVRDKNFRDRKHLYIAFGILSFVMVLCSLKMITIMLSGYKSHREVTGSIERAHGDFSLNALNPFVAFDEAINLLIIGKEHHGARPFLSFYTVLFAAVIVLVSCCLFRKINRNLKLHRAFGIALAVLATEILAYEIVQVVAYRWQIPHYMGFGTFQFNRISFFYPAILRIVECIGLAVIYQFIVDLAKCREKDWRGITVNAIGVAAIATYALYTININAPVFVKNYADGRFTATFTWAAVPIVVALVASIAIWAFPRVKSAIINAGRALGYVVVIAIASATCFWVNTPLYLFGPDSIFGERYEDWYVANWQKLFTGRHTPNNPTFEQFFDTKLFDEIAAEIGAPKSAYETCALGMFPSVLSYNHFNTLDGHVQIYSLEKWHELRAILEPEIVKDTTGKLNDWYAWGNQGYMISHEVFAQRGLDFVIPKTAEVKVNEMEWNFFLLETAAAGRPVYLFSAAEILDTYFASRLVRTANHPDGFYDHPKSWWGIYLYRIAN